MVQEALATKGLSLMEQTTKGLSLVIQEAALGYLRTQPYGAGDCLRLPRDLASWYPHMKLKNKILFFSETDRFQHLSQNFCLSCICDLCMRLN
jgi:hypothetical protein